MYKTYYLKIFLQFFIAVFFSIVIHAQSFTYKIYSPADGLPFGSIGQLYTDSYGYIWISSCGGLTRYDGKTFTNYGLQDGLPYLCNYVSFEDRQHQLWFTSNNNRDFSVIKFSEGRFTEFPFMEPDSIDYIFSLAQSPEGTIQAMTSKGVFALENKHWKKIELIKNTVGKMVRQVLYLEDGSVAINFVDRIILRKKNGSAEVIADTSLCEWYTTIATRNNMILITGTDRLFVYDKNELKPVYDSVLKGNRIYSSFIDSKNRFWVAAASAGVFAFNGDNFLRFSLDDGLPNTLVLGFCEDRDGNIWLGDSRGLIRLRESQVKIFNITNGLGISDVRSMFMNKNGNIFFGHPGPGNPFTYMEKQKIFQDKANRNISSTISIITSFAEDEKGDMWLTNYAESLLRYSKGQLGNMNFILGNKSGSSSAVLFYPPGQSLLFNADSAILKIKNERIVDEIPVIIDNKQVNEIISMYKDKHDNIWLSTFAGFGTIDLEKKVFHSAGIKTDKNFVSRFKEDKTGNIWIAISGKGVYKMQLGKEYQYSISELINDKNGLPDNVIQDIAFDSTGSLWVVSANGVTRVDLHHKNMNGLYTHQTFSAEEGVTAKSLTDATLLADRNNGIWLATGDGVFRFNTNTFITDTLAPITHIENISLLNDSSGWKTYTSSFSDYFHLPVNPVLPYNKNNINIFYNAITYTRREDVVYKYRLTGLDTNYTETSSPYASFINLAPGSYTFHVQSRKKNTSWSEEATFSFTITPPFWETWWFRILTIIAASSVLIFAFRFRLQQIRKSNTIQQQIKDLELKALKAQMNPHFIYNAMNSIQSLVINDQPEQSVRYLGKFAKLLRQVLDNSDKSFIPLEQELAALQLYIELEALRLHINFDYSIDVVKTLDARDERVPPLVLQPYVENALWHGLSNKGGEKKLQISVDANDLFLLCIITDNGIGRTKAAEIKSKHTQEHTSKGIDITRRRLALISNENDIPVIIEDLLDALGNAAGTSVTVKIPRQPEA